MLAFGQPQPLPAHWDPPIRTTCTHAQCRTVQTGPLSDVRAVLSGVHNGRHHRTAFRTPRVRSSLAGRPDPWRTRSPPSGIPLPNRKGRGQATDERHGKHWDILGRQTTKTARRDAEPLLWKRRLQLGTQGRLGDGNIASATAATRQLLGVAPPSKARLGALLSSVGI
jgi:hypothetical protein